MRVLVLWAHEDSPNLGVAALARGSHELLRSAWPDADFTFVNFGRRPEWFFIGSPRAMLRERLTGRHGMRRALADFDVVWDTRSGDSFTDIYGQGRDRLMSTIYEMAVRAGAHGVLAPQTIGPFDTAQGRRRARRTLGASTLAFARDPQSAAAAEILGRPVDDTIADVVFALPSQPVPTTTDVLLNVSGLLWQDNPHVDAAEYRHTVREVAEALRGEGREVTLLAHVVESSVPDSDAAVVRGLAAELDLPFHIPDGLDDVRGVIASSRLVIAARMHACLNALSQGVPAIPMAYSRKFAPLLNSIGWERGVDLREGGAPVEAVLEQAHGGSLTTDAGQVAQRARTSIERCVSSLRTLGPGARL